MMRLPDEFDMSKITTGVRWWQSCCAIFLGLWSGLPSQRQTASVLLAWVASFGKVSGFALNLHTS